ncbi:DUF6705 family protein [Bizionia hallyeonensis]|uniref:DUF6705 family protein n=1 Tax=Bizionia hallyeonensis TaxID=1123757 RepID=A0ABW0C470_9FLAO
MKSPIYLVIVFILTTISCKAQIIPVEQVVNNFENVEEGVTTYIKDVNHVLDDYVGTWTGNTNNKEYTFIITEKTIVFDEQYNIDIDVLVMKYLILDASNFNVIEDTRSLPDENAPCQGVVFRQFSGSGLSYEFYYSGEDYFCGQNGEVYVTLKNNNTQLFLSLGSNHEKYSQCQTGWANQVLPENGILLTKQ